MRGGGWCLTEEEGEMIRQRIKELEEQISNLEGRLLEASDVISEHIERLEQGDIAAEDLGQVADDLREALSSCLDIVTSADIGMDMPMMK